MGRVLVVDDHEPTCVALSKIVVAAGHEARCALGGTDALDQLRQGVPDLVILDYMMPDINGLDVLREIRRDVRTAEVPVIMYSAIADASIQAYAIAQGANEYWIKATMDFEKFRTRLETFIPPR